jgi:DNA-binding CsgD family transcriptional regulator
LEAAAALVAEQEAVKEVTGIRLAAYGARLLAAHQGRTNDVSPLMSAVDKEFIEHGDDGYALKIASLASAVLNNGLGRYTEAFAAAREVADEISFLETWVLYELIEAGVRSGRREAADDALQRLLTVTVAGSDWSEGVEARSRALLSTGEDAEHWYTQSTACLARTPLRPELARSHLVYGEWLRREGRRVDARQQLGAAYEMFATMGAEGFAERARRELLATGQKVRRREVDTQHELTPQEEHIARLARDGRSNVEIGAELFISVRTVEWHLRKVFTKLGITSRKGLNDALPARSRYAGSTSLLEI